MPKKDEKPKGTMIHGIAASEHLDSSGERIKVEGIDISSLTKDAVFNWEHQSKEASAIIGKITKAKKILKRSDCEDDYQRKFWDKIKMPYLYVAGELFDAVGHQAAKDVAAMLRYDQQADLRKTKRLINFSIEGARLEKNGPNINKCIARKITVTITPCNKVCEAEELKEEETKKSYAFGTSGHGMHQENFSMVENLMNKAEIEESSCQIMEKTMGDYKPKRTFSPKDAPEKLKTGDRISYKDQPKAKTGADIYGKPPKESSFGKATELPGEFKPKYAKDLPPKEAKKQKKELKEYKQKMDKMFVPTKANSFGNKGDLQKKKKKKVDYTSNVRKAIAAGGMGAAPGAKVQGSAVQKSDKNVKKGMASATSNYATVTPSKPGSFSMGKSEHYLMRKSEVDWNEIEKASKNIREQRRKVWGSKSQPGAKSKMRPKHMEHIKQFANNFLGLDLNPSGGKIDPKTGERRDKDAKKGIDKPDWRSGQFESQWNPEAAVHEIAHIMLLPEGVGLEEGQQLMDKQYSDVQQQYGYMKQKRSQHEVQPMAAEQLIRRAMGLPASQVSVPAKKDDPPRTAVEDPSQEIATRVKSGKTRSGEDKYVDLIRQSKNLHPEHRERLHKIFTGQLKFNPDTGWIPNEGADAKINARAMNERAAQKTQQPQAPERDNVLPMKQQQEKPAPQTNQPDMDTQNWQNKKKIAVGKSEITQAWKQISQEAFDNFSKKEKLVGFLQKRLPNLNKHQINALAKAVAYVHMKKQEKKLQDLID